MLVTAYFSESGSSKPGLNPTVDVIDLSDGTLTVGAGAMTDRGRGFYTYAFAGYSAVSDFAVICDSVALVGTEQYAVATIDSFLGTDANVLISTDAQDLSGSLDVNTKKIEGADATDQIGDAAHDEVIEGTLTNRQIQRIFLSVLAGLSDGGGTTENKFRDLADAKDRVDATVTKRGNRTAVTLDGT